MSLLDDLFDGADDFLEAPLQIPAGRVTLEDDWGDDWFDD
jgi:hypothetical protein